MKINWSSVLLIGSLIFLQWDAASRGNLSQTIGLGIIALLQLFRIDIFTFEPIPKEEDVHP